MDSKQRELVYNAMKFAVHDITGRVLREATLLTMMEDFEKTIPKEIPKSSIPVFQSNDWQKAMDEVFGV